MGVEESKGCPGRALSPPSQPLHRRGGRWAERRAPSHGELDREAGAGGRREMVDWAGFSAVSDR